MTKEYYNKLAQYYKYIYQDWDKSVVKQADDIDSMIREFFGQETRGRLLDVSCGIGTQAIGLAELGYAVTASDISEEEIRIAKGEAEKRKLDITFSVADMRKVSEMHDEKFDVVLSADNSIPHLLNDEEILNALKGFHSLLNTGGGCIVTVRDYENINKDGKKEILNPRQVHAVPNGKIVMFDLWEFEGEYYNFCTYLVEDTGADDLNTIAMRSRYYCVTTSKLETLFKEAGFSDVKILKDRFFQPVILGIR
jgi:SAM-dependent methyltransferase